MSDLLNQASLVYIPSGYKEDTAYSVIPTNGSGDLTFTRASDGTRVNSQGLVERVPWNLMQYSEDYNTGWSKARYTSTGNSTTAPNGTNTASLIDDGTATGIHLIERKTEAIAGAGISISIYAKYIDTQYLFFATYDTSYNGVCFDIQNGSVGNNTTGSVGTIESVGNGWFRCSVYYAANTRLDPWVSFGLRDDNTAAFENGAGANRQAYVWGAQAVIGTTAKPYFPTTDRLNVPRLDYSNGCPSLLLEPQRTNLATYSEQFDNGAWSKEDISVTSNATTSPDGTQNADKVIANTNNTDHTIYQNTTTSANEYFTVYAKAGEYNYVFLGANNSVATDGVFFNLSNGTISQNTSSLTATITDAGNGWYRCGVYSSSWPYVYRIICLSENGTSFGFAGDNSKGIYVWGAQVEAGSYPTSYIPTTSASVTRVADAAYKTGISSLIGQTEGTLFVDTIINGNVNPILMQIINNTNNYTESIYIEFNKASNIIQVNAYDSGTIQAQMSTSATIGQRYKIGFAYKANDFAFYVNGAQIGVDNSGSVQSGLQDLFIGCLKGNLSAQDFNGNILNQSVLFKTRLTNAELAALTTL